MHKWGRKQYVLLVTGVIGCIVLVYCLLYLRMVQPVKTELASLDQQVTMYERQTKQLQKKENSNSPSDQPDVFDTIPTQTELDRLLLELQDMASSANITINHIQSVTEEENEAVDLPEGIRAVSYTLEASAQSLKQVNTFLQTIETCKRLVTIDSIHVDRNSDKPVLTLTFSIFVIS
ncbi:type 4a pilus biogenesis protein PilO [Lentibacillus sp. N15]|uniref:type 4a pilus biogenesis protein PilO n=1 Tax=Lentibacillus songyuanensis TaxID=3136161 RepID=UPI0031BABCFA